MQFKSKHVIAYCRTQIVGFPMQMNQFNYQNFEASFGNVTDSFVNQFK